MRRNLKRAWSGVATLAVAASTATVFNAPAAFAAGTLEGPAAVRSAGGAATLASGNSGTTFTIRPPSGAACPGDSANDNYLVQTYMVPASVDPSTLTFDADGPVPLGTGASFRQPLYSTTSQPVVSQLTAPATVAPGPGAIINIPDMNYGAFAPGDIPAGVYNIGIACTLGPPSATQMKNFYNVQKTFTTPGGGPAAVNWSVGAVPAAPVLSSVTPGDGQVTANFTPTTSDPVTTLFTATATPPSGPAVTATSTTGSPIVIPGLTNGTAYSVTVRATNAVGDSAESNAVSGTPALGARPPVTGLTATPGTAKVNLSWTAPTGTAPTGYQVTVNPNAGTTTTSGTTAEVTGLTPGTPYTFTVTPLHPAPFVGTPASVGPVAPLAAQVLVQDVTVVRPAGAIVLTQICGKNGAIAADTLGTPGFPSGSLPAIAATGPGVGTAPSFSGGPDPKFSEYPYPENADGTPAPNYPTNCGISLGTAKFVKKGPGGGQFFAASGVLNQVTVVDTRDTDTGWNATGTMSAFTAGAGKTFSGSQLGWSPVRTSDTAAFSDSDGTSYDQVVDAGPVVAPNTPNATGLSSGRTLGIAAGLAGAAPTLTGGLGIAELDARLKLLIPVTAQSGTYVGTLTFSVL